MKKLIFVTLFALFITACAANTPAPAPTPDIAAMVAATLTAYVPAAEEMPTALPAPVGGSISGGLGYPSSFIPPLKVVAFRVGSDEFFFVQTQLNQTSYRIENLPEGKYHVVGYALNEDGSASGLAGGYTQAVLCGLTVECTEHSLVDVVVFDGEESAGADVSDWYGGTFPPMP
jgi:hypothetical protein